MRESTGRFINFVETLSRIYFPENEHYIKKQMKERTLVEDQNFSTFLNQFAFNIDLLNYKLQRLKGVNAMDKTQQFEYLTVFDSIIAQLRAMFLENRNSNFTFQRYFREINRQDIVEKINNYLDSPFDIHNSGSIRERLKFLADKFICHYDTVSQIDIGTANYICATLANPHATNNLNSILQNLKDIIES